MLVLQTQLFASFLVVGHQCGRLLQNYSWDCEESSPMEEDWLSQYRVSNTIVTIFRLQLKCDGTRRHTGGEMKGKLANGVGSQYLSH